MIARLTPQDVLEVAGLHGKTLPNDFLPNLGHKFLEIMHSGVLAQKNVYGFGWRENGKIVGFIIGTLNSEVFFPQIIKSKFLPLALCLIFQLIKNPGILKKIFETFLYPQKEKGPKAELVVIGILKKYQGRGIGKKLVKALEKKFCEFNIKKYKVTCYADKQAVFFYNSLGFKKISEFMLYNKLWCLYAKNLQKKKIK